MSMILTNEILIIKPDFITGACVGSVVWGPPKLLPAYAQRFHLKPVLCGLL